MLKREVLRSKTQALLDGYIDIEEFALLVQIAARDTIQQRAEKQQQQQQQERVYYRSKDSLLARYGAVLKAQTGEEHSTADYTEDEPEKIEIAVRRLATLYAQALRPGTAFDAQKAAANVVTLNSRLDGEDLAQIGNRLNLTSTQINERTVTRIISFLKTLETETVVRLLDESVDIEDIVKEYNQPIEDMLATKKQEKTARTEAKQAKAEARKARDKAREEAAARRAQKQHTAQQKAAALAKRRQERADAIAARKDANAAQKNRERQTPVKGNRPANPNTDAVIGPVLAKRRQRRNGLLL